VNIAHIEQLCDCYRCVQTLKCEKEAWQALCEERKQKYIEVKM